MSWSVMVGAIGGIVIRVHALFLLYIVIELLWSVSPPVKGIQTPLGFRPTAAMMAILVILAFAHEIGHCLACRLTGGVATEVLLWPLGGLAACQPSNRWQAHLLTAMAGPAVNLLICVMAGGMLWANTGRFWGVAIPNPLQPFEILQDAELNLAGSWALLALFLVNVVSMFVLLFNLLPMFPLDGARTLHAFLWPQMGYVSAMRLVVRLGIVCAAMLFVYGAIMRQIPPVAVALFGAFVSWTTHRQLEFTETMLGYESGLPEVEQVFGEGAGEQGDDLEINDPTAEAGTPGEAELDRVLQKIGESGIESLTTEERALLEDATRRRKERE